MLSYRNILLCCAAALVAGRPQAPPGPPAEILEFENNVDLDGYQFRFQTSDGIARSESGKLQDVGTENEAMEVNGDVSFTTNDGKKVTIKYVSGKGGYRPVLTIS